MDYMLLVRIYILVLTFLCGACMGSFVNCVADRYAEKQSVFEGRSHCPVCGHKLGVLDLIPIFSYLFLRGRCRHCKAKIPIRCLLTELMGGLVFLAVELKVGLKFEAIEFCLLTGMLFAVALIDHDTMEIPDGLHLFALVIFVGFLWAHDDWYNRLVQGLWGALVYGGGMLLMSLVMDVILKKESLGGGDVKLYGVLGLFTGLYGGLILLILSCLFGLLYAAIVRAKSEFAFGPWIALAGYITLLVGPEVVNLYLSLL